LKSVPFVHFARIRMRIMSRVSNCSNDMVMRCRTTRHLRRLIWRFMQLMRNEYLQAAANAVDSLKPVGCCGQMDEAWLATWSSPFAVEFSEIWCVRLHASR
jgi:hypothetical protein